MPAFSKESAFFDSLSDEESYHKYNQEQTAKKNYEDSNNQFKDKSTFSAEVLAPCQECTNITPLSDNTNERIYVTKVRCNSLDDNMLDHPSSVSDPKAKQMIIDQHQTAYLSIDPTLGLPTPGSKVSCNYHDAGPNEDGKQRGLRIAGGATGGAGGGFVGGAGFGGPGAAFGNAQSYPAGQFAPPDSPTYKAEDYPPPNEDTLKAIIESFGETYQRPLVEDLRLIGVRYPVKENNVNQFRDVLNVFVSTQNGIQVSAYQITTSPAPSLLGTDSGSKYGTANVATGRKLTWALGVHHDYAAGSMRDSAHQIRDNNRDGIPDGEPNPPGSILLETSGNGFNLHKSNNGSNFIGGASKDPTNDQRVKEGSSGMITYAVIDGQMIRRNINTWAHSAGCQVFLYTEKAFNLVIAQMQKNLKVNNIKRYNYYLLDYVDYVNITQGKSFSGKALMDKRNQQAKEGEEIRKSLPEPSYTNDQSAIIRDQYKEKHKKKKK